MSSASPENNVDATSAPTPDYAAAAPSIPHESADKSWMELWGERVGDSMLFAAPVQCICAQCRHPRPTEGTPEGEVKSDEKQTNGDGDGDATDEIRCTSNPLTYDPELPTLSTGGRYFAFRRGACNQCARQKLGHMCSASTANSGQVWVFDTVIGRWETHVAHGLWYSQKTGMRGRRVRRPMSFSGE